MMNGMMKMKRAMMLLAVAGVVVLALGCNNARQDQAYNALFKSDGQERVSRFVNVQAANGARNDAMLYSHHFTGAQLNSLGRGKVLLMLDECEDCETMVVHLVNAGEGHLLAQRKASVELYLKTTEGANERVLHPAAPNLVRFAKTESGSIEAPSAAEPPQAAPPMIPQAR